MRSRSDASLRFPGPRWLHAALCFALGLACVVVGLIGTVASAYALAAPRLPMVVVLVLLAILLLALASRRLGLPRPRLWMLAMLFGLLVGAIWAGIGLEGGLYA